jgi:hypothetical protein
MQINGNWHEAAENFHREVMPVLRLRGPEIGQLFRAGDESAGAVVRAYALLQRSFDPVNDLIIRDALKKMGMMS